MMTNILEEHARVHSQSTSSAKIEHDTARMFKLNENPNPAVVDWAGPDDPENPRNWTVSTKNLHVVMISLFTLNA
jgi:hypothetical protein